MGLELVLAVLALLGAQTALLCSINLKLGRLEQQVVDHGRRIDNLEGKKHGS